MPLPPLPIYRKIFNSWILNKNSVIYFRVKPCNSQAGSNQMVLHFNSIFQIFFRKSKFWPNIRFCHFFKSSVLLKPMQSHTIGNSLNQDFPKKGHLNCMELFLFETLPKQENKYEFKRIRVFTCLTTMEVPHDQLHEVQKEKYC